MELNATGYKLDALVKRFNLTNFTPDIDISDREVSVADVNRTALQLNGFFDYFEGTRIQLMGMVEHAYLEKFTLEERKKVYDKLFSYHIPALIYSRSFEPGEAALEMAKKHGVPLFGTDRGTSEFMAELIYTLNRELAPCTTMHGVLVDVYGEGVLITGESGIGKSEAALELIRRGHRLVSDDVVEIRRVNSQTLRGRAPSVTKHFIELRGIGIIDVKSLYGVECVKEDQKIDLVIKLQDWHKDTEYDRIGMYDEFMDILGLKIKCHSLPIRPGRNLAVICETAAVNHRQKKMGYNAAEELYKRIQDNMTTQFPEGAES